MAVFLPNKALRVLLVTDSFVFLASAMIGPIYAIFVERLNGNVLDAGLTSGLYALVAGIVTILAGVYSDKVRRNEYVVIAGYALVGVGYILYQFVDSTLALFAIQALLGIGAGIHMPAYKALYSKNLDDMREGVEWGLWEGLTYFAIAGGAALGGVIAYLYGFPYVFAAMSVLCFLSAAYIYVQPKGVFLNYPHPEPGVKSGKRKG